jgi:hypothetical protein
MELIDWNDFARVELRVGRARAADSGTVRTPDRALPPGIRLL